MSIYLSNLSVLHNLKCNVITSSKHSFNENELKQISQFYFKHYKIGNSAIKISWKDLERYLNLNCELLLITNKFIMGSIISILIPIKIENQNKNKYSKRFEFYRNDNEHVFGCTSFLILSSKYRNKGYGFKLIHESLKILHKNKGKSAYFINSKSRCKNSIDLNFWHFPVNLEKLNLCNMFKNYKYLFNDIETVNRTIKVNINNAKTAYNFYQMYMKNKKFYFSPSFEYWIKWIESFPTFIIYDNEIIGLFSFDFHLIEYSYKIGILNGMLISCIGKQPNTLISSINQGKKMYDLLTLYEIGDLNKNLLSSVFAQKSHKKVINFYNTDLNVKKEDFYVPVF